jgi:NAD(P)-dependent dehydrogenase (short-subunit alcohol dehydrogenase family)
MCGAGPPQLLHRSALQHRGRYSGIPRFPAEGYGRARFSLKADLSSYEETRKLHAEVVEGLGHPTILFNNAGLTMGKSGVKDISEISVEDFEQTWRANCGTGFLLTQLCLPKMVEQGWGRVVFCSSVAAFTGGVVGPHYAYVWRWRAFLQAYTVLTLAG